MLWIKTFLIFLLTTSLSFSSEKLYGPEEPCQYLLYSQFRSSNRKIILQHPPFKNVHAKSFKNIHPYQYEIDLARMAELDLEEVIAITRNFHYQPVLSSETGILRIDEKVLINPNWNLINAYKKFIGYIDLDHISYNDLILLRRESMNYVQNKKSGKFSYRDKIKFNSKSKTLITDPIQEDVFNKLDQLKQKYDVLKTDQIRGKFSYLKHRLKKRNIKKVTIITHPEQNIIEQNLLQYVEDLNKVLNSAYLSPEAMVTFAVRELLIVHPFGDGNGRTARLLGQILYKKLTGKTIIFPKEFKKEMSFTEAELIKLIAK